MVQLRDCSKIIVKRTFVPLLALYKVSMNSVMDTTATFSTEQQLNRFMCIITYFWYTFTVAIEIQWPKYSCAPVLSQV